MLSGAAGACRRLRVVLCGRTGPEEGRGAEKTLQPGGKGALRRSMDGAAKAGGIGEELLKALRNEVVRLALLSDDSLDGELFQGIAGKLEEPELLELKRVYERRAGERFWAEPQLKGGTDSGGDRGDGAFLI